MLANITLSGFQAPASITEREISNVCDNTYAAWLMDGRPGYSTSAEYYAEIRRGDYDDERRTTLSKTSDGYVGKVYNYFDEGKFWAIGCYVKIPANWARLWDDGEGDVLRVFFSSYSAGGDFDSGESESKLVPNWYLLAPEMPLDTTGRHEANIPAKAALHLGQKVVRLAGYDLYGGDIEGGLIRNVEAEACWAACEARNDCDAATHDRWNRICFLKSVSSSRQKLYLLSKADTYVEPEKAKKLSRVSNMQVMTFTKSDKAFAGSPDQAFTTPSLETCRSSCTDMACLGFNWVSSSQRCELFEIPDVYSDRPGTTVGFMVQPASQ